WLLEGADNQGSGGFAQINSWLLKAEPPAGKIEIFRDNAPEGAHITSVDDNTIRLKARLFLDRYLLTGMVSSRTISITDLQGERQDILIKNTPQAGLLADIRLTSDARHIVQMNSDGEFFFYEAATQKMTLAGRFVDGEIIFYTPEAYYWSSYEGAHFVQL